MTSIVASGTATIGRSFGHSLRRAVSVRHSSASRYSRDVRGASRPSSLASNNSASHRHSAGTIAEETSPNRHSGTFLNLRPDSAYDLDNCSSNRSSIISTSSISTISSTNPSSVPTVGPISIANTDRTHHLSSVQRVVGGGAESPTSVRLHTSSPQFYTDSSASSLSGGSTSSLPPAYRGAAGGRSRSPHESPQRLESKSPQPGASQEPPQWLRPKSPQPAPGRQSPLAQSKQAHHDSAAGVAPPPPPAQDRSAVQPDGSSSSSSLDSLDKTMDSIHYYDTPL